MGRVFFVHPIRPNNDISGALEYGEPRYVNPDYVFADTIERERIPDGFAANMRRAAADFDPEHDLLAIVGDHLQLVAFSGLLMQLHGERHDIRVLRWDRNQCGYFPVRLSGVTASLPA